MYVTVEGKQKAPEVEANVRRLHRECHHLYRKAGGSDTVDFAVDVFMKKGWVGREQKYKIIELFTVHVYGRAWCAKVYASTTIDFEGVRPSNRLV